MSPTKFTFKHGYIPIIIIKQFFNQAEARLWAKRQARAEAREIRMRELERMQREQEENADRQFDMMVASTEPVWAGPRGRGAPTTTRHRPASRRNSEDSLEDGGGGGGSLRDLRVSLFYYRRGFFVNRPTDWIDSRSFFFKFNLFRVEMQNNAILNQLNLQAELKEVEERFRKAMIANAQLDNDKTSQTYQLELLKDR